MIAAPPAPPTERQVTEAMRLADDSPRLDPSTLGPSLITVRVEDSKGNPLAFRPKQIEDLPRSSWNRIRPLPLPTDPQKVRPMVSDRVEIQALRLTPEGSTEQVEVTWTAIEGSEHYKLELPAGEAFVLQACGMHVGAKDIKLPAEPKARSPRVTMRLGPALEPAVLEIAIQDPPGQLASLGYWVRLNTPGGVQLSSWRRVTRMRPSGASFLGEAMDPDEHCIVAFQVPAGRYTVDVVSDKFTGSVVNPQTETRIFPGPGRAVVDLVPGKRRPIAVQMEGLAKISLYLPPGQMKGAELVHLDGGKLEFDKSKTWTGTPGRIEIILPNKAGAERKSLITTQAGDWLAVELVDNQWSLRPMAEVRQEWRREQVDRILRQQR